ncbi:hypothetical protein RCL1_006596 [Eukaryota sp. TZLM3-RCL]
MSSLIKESSGTKSNTAPPNKKLRPSAEQQEDEQLPEIGGHDSTTSRLTALENDVAQIKQSMITKQDLEELKQAVITKQDLE